MDSYNLVNNTPANIAGHEGHVITSTLKRDAGDGLHDVMELESISNTMHSIYYTQLTASVECGTTTTNNVVLLYVDIAHNIYLYRKENGFMGAVGDANDMHSSASKTESYILKIGETEVTLFSREFSHDTGNNAGYGGGPVYGALFEFPMSDNVLPPTTDSYNRIFDIEESLFELCGEYSMALDNRHAGASSVIIVSGRVDKPIALKVASSMWCAFALVQVGGGYKFNAFQNDSLDCGYDNVHLIADLKYINFVNLGTGNLLDYVKEPSETGLQFHPVGLA